MHSFAGIKKGNPFQEVQWQSLLGDDHDHPKVKGYGEVKGKANDIMCVCSVPTQYPDIKYFSNRP